jgi:predicted TIM-barrel fold metal-dependent hydrolase
MIVDTHLHPLSPDEGAYPRLETSRFQGTNTDEDVLAQMRGAGVDRVTLVQFFGVYGNDNAYVADCVARHPEAFAGVGCVDPLAPDAADKLAYWVKDRGLSALRLFTPRGRDDLSRWPDEPIAYPLLRQAEALGIPVCLSMSPPQLGNLPGVLTRFGTLTVVLDHAANVPVDPTAEETQRLFALASHTNLHLKYSNQNFSTVDDAAVITSWLGALKDTFGVGRLMWGSNYPVNKGAVEPYRDLVELGQAVLSGFTPEDAELMLGGTAQRVFGLK